MKSGDILGSWLKEKLPRVCIFQDQLRDFSKQFKLLDYKYVEVKGIKNTVKLVLDFIVWQIRYRFFREKYFFKKKVLVATFLSLVENFASIESRSGSSERISDKPNLLN